MVLLRAKVVSNKKGRPWPPFVFLISDDLLVILPTQLMHRIDKRADIFRVDAGVDAVTEVEDVAFALAVAGEYIAHFFTNAIRCGVEDAGVHIALQGDLVAGDLAGIAEVDGPVDAETVGSGGSHLVQPLTAAFGVENHGHLAAVIFTGQSIDDLLHVAQ